MAKKRVLILTFVIVLLISTIIFVNQYKNSDSRINQNFQSLNPQQRVDIGKSWNPPRTKDCALIIAEISSVTISNKITDQEIITNLIIKNTKYAAAGLFKLSKTTADAKIAIWSLSAAAILSKFPEAIESKNQSQVADLYDQIGKMVGRPPITCDNTLATTT